MKRSRTCRPISNMVSKTLPAFVAMTLALAGNADAEHHARPVKNIVVYQKDGRFGGWPANHGIWSWGNEIVVGFESGHYQYSENNHAISRTRPAYSRPREPSSPASLPNRVASWRSIAPAASTSHTPTSQ